MGLRCERYGGTIGTNNAQWIARTKLGTRAEVLELYNVKVKGRPDQVEMKCFQVRSNNPLRAMAGPACSNCEYIRT